MRCLECGNDLIPGFSECFSCGAALAKVQSRANSSYHESISRNLQNSASPQQKSKSEFMDEYFAKDLDFSNSKKKAQMKFSSYTTYLSSPAPGSSPAYLAASSREKLMSSGNSHSPRNQRTPYEAAAEDLPETSFAPKKTPQKSLDEMERDILLAGRETNYSIVALGRQHAAENEALRGTVASPADKPKRWSKFEPEDTTSNLDHRNGVWNPEDQMYPWRNTKKYVKAYSSPYSSNQQRDEGFVQSPTNAIYHQQQQQQHLTPTSPNQFQNLNITGKSNSFAGMVVTSSRTPTPHDLNLQQQQQQQQSQQQTSRQNQIIQTQQQQQQQQSPPVPSFSLLSTEENIFNMMGNNPNYLPFNAHAAAFLIEMYATNLHEQMLVHRSDMLRGMSAILRERVAFEKASEEIRRAETFAARASAIRSIESSKMSQENADLRFELEEAWAAVERQKQITESVANELAEVKAMYETSQMAFQSLGSPLANQQHSY